MCLVKKIKMVRQTPSLLTPKHRPSDPLAYELGLKAGRAFGRLLASRPELANMSKTRLAKLTAIVIRSYGVHDPQTTAENLLSFCKLNQLP
jgi:hypothetical protein